MLFAVSSGLSRNKTETNIYKVVEMTGELSDIGVLAYSRALFFCI